MILWSVLILISDVTAGSMFPPYRLIFQTDTTSARTGSVTLTCQNGTTLEEINVQNVMFWLNTTQQDLGEVIGCCSITFNLTRNLEGSYTCGKISGNGTRHESLPVELICKFKIQIYINAL